MVRTVVVDDSKVVRVRVAEMLSELPGVEVVGQAADVREGCARIDEMRPDLVIADLRMPGGSGMDVITHAKRHHDSVVVVVLTNFPYKQYRDKCLELGADYFLDKSVEFERLTQRAEDLRSLQGDRGNEKGPQ